MVFFTCAHCGESLKKNKVEKHYQTVCSKIPVSLTCVDCCKDFSVETYPGHTKCISEEEKYSAKGFVPRPSANKGEKKQKKWQDVIQTMQENPSGFSNEERTILNIIVKHENVPRKKSKFQNFLRNTMSNRFNMKAGDSVFDKLEAANKEGTESKEEIKAQENHEKQNESVKEDEKENADSSCVKENGDSPKEEAENEEKLSKKEKKEKRKRAKYEAELKEIESNQIPEAEDNEDEGAKKKKKSKKGVGSETVENEGTEKDKKSKKKNKGEIETAETEENGIAEGEEKPKKKKKHKEAIETEENGIAEEEEKSKKRHKETIEDEIAEGEEKPKKKKKNKGAVESTENVPEDVEMIEEGKSKKHKKETEKSKKKRKMGNEESEEQCDEPANKKVKETGTEEIAEDSAVPVTGKFSWQDVIAGVLKSKDSKELSLKKLRKKVLSEFEALGCGSASDTKIIAKFNKKIQKMPDVVVHKEIAKLVVEN